MDNNNLLIIIQARMTSTRLPGKVLLPLCGKSVLEIMLDRLEKFRKNIVIATTDDGSETPIVSLCERMGIPYYTGDTNNVLERYFLCASQFKADENTTIVRLTSDCPLIDEAVLDAVIRYFQQGGFDYAANVLERTFPRGLDCEVFSFAALEKAYKNATTDFEKEHVTTYIHTTHRSEFSIGSYTYPKDMSRYRLTLDEADDYRAIQEIYQQFGCRTDFTFEALLEVLEKNPHIHQLNAHIEQKKN